VTYLCVYIFIKQLTASSLIYFNGDSCFQGLELQLPRLNIQIAGAKAQVSQGVATPLPLTLFHISDYCTSLVGMVFMGGMPPGPLEGSCFAFRSVLHSVTFFIVCSVIINCWLAFLTFILIKDRYVDKSYGLHPFNLGWWLMWCLTRNQVACGSNKSGGEIFFFFCLFIWVI